MIHFHFSSKNHRFILFAFIIISCVLNSVQSLPIYQPIDDQFPIRPRRPLPNPVPTPLPVPTPPPTPQVQPFTIYEYQGKINITIENGQYAEINYWLSFMKSFYSCLDKECYAGWITRYTSAGQDSYDDVAGYPNAEGEQPVFQFFKDGNGNYTVKLSNLLKPTWRQIIEIVAQRLNLEGLRSIGLARRLIPNTQYIDERQVPMVRQTLMTKRSNFRQSTVIQQDNMVSSVKDSYEIQLQTDKDVQATSTPLIYGESSSLQPQFRGNVQVNMNMNTKRLSNVDQINSLKDTFNAQSGNSQSRSNTQIQTQRYDINSNIVDTEFPTYDMPPVINQIGTNPLPNEQINIQFRDEIIQSYSYRERTIPRNQYNYFRLLQTVSYPLVNYNKLLFQRTVLGKDIKLQLRVSCNATMSLGNTSLGCTASLVYTIFGSPKLLKIFDIGKPVTSAFNWTQRYNGSWSFQLSIPLPPPVSFLTLRFSIGISYYIGVGLTAQLLPGNIFQFKAIVETGIDTVAKAAIRAVVIQGGVYIKGVLVKVWTDPTVTLKFLLLVDRPRIDFNFNWYFNTLALQFEWGFYYRYWRPFKWSGDKIIAKWQINSGISSKTLIYQAAFPIYY